MTPEQGYDLAQLQRPGVKIVMGPYQAREERISPRGRAPQDRAYGDSGGMPTPVANTASSWFEYDCARLVGRARLSAWEIVFMFAAADAREQSLPLREDVAFLTAPHVSLTSARAYVLALRETAGA